MSHYEFWSLVFLENIDPTNVGGRNNRVLVVQLQGIRNNGESTKNNTISALQETENKRQQRKQKLDMYQSITNRKSESKKTLVMKATKVTDDALQLGGKL